MDGAGDHLADHTQGLSLSPGTHQNVQFLLKAVEAGEARLVQDGEGKVQVLYTNEQRSRLSHVDQSKAHTVQEGKDAGDVKVKVDVCLEMIDAIKKSRAPAGVVIDKSKAKTSPLGSYMEGKQFEKLQEVLGKGSVAGDIVVVKDTKTHTEQAVKTVMISDFRTDEVRAWVDLGESESFPSLYVFRMVGNKIVFHMEKIENGVTLDDVINEHMWNLRGEAPELTRPFSLSVFHGLLSVVKEMQDKNWAHRDLHGGNAMLSKDTMRLKVLDFGMARPLRQGLEFAHDALKSDILNAIRLFCGLYTGQYFDNSFVLEKEIKAGTLRELLRETSVLSEGDREELLQLIGMTYRVTQAPEQPGYGDTTVVMETIEGKLKPDKTTDILRTAAAVLFPDFYYDARDIDMRAQAGVEVADCGGKADQVDAFDFDLDAAAAAVPEAFLRKLRISM